MEVKIEIPDNCKLVKEGNTYIVKEKLTKPKSWGEFCGNYPITATEHFIGPFSNIIKAGKEGLRIIPEDRNLCVSKEEAEAFLALMQLRQLRKAWIGNWEQPTSFTEITVIIYNVNDKKLVAESGHYWSLLPLSFPTKKMAKEFLECFRDLCETAKILL